MKTTETINQTGDDLNVFDHLTATPANIHEIAAATGISLAEVDAPLCRLVKLGLAKRMTGAGGRNLFSK